MTKKENIKKNDQPVHSVQQQNAKRQSNNSVKNNKTGTQSEDLNVVKSPNTKKTDKPAYGIFVLAGVVLVLLVFTVVHFIRSEGNSAEQKAAIETTEAEGLDSNIYFAGIPLGGMKYEEFKKTISSKAPEILSDIKLTFNNEKASEANERANDMPETEASETDVAEETVSKVEQETLLSADEIGASFDLEKIYKNAEKLSELLKSNKSKKASLFSSVALAEENKRPKQTSEIAELATVENDKYNLIPVFTCDRATLTQKVNELAEDVNIEPSVAEAINFNLETYEFEFDEGKVGYQLKTEDLVQDIETALIENEIDKPIELKFEEVEADKSMPEDAEIGYIASASTDLVSYDPPRDANVARVAELLTGIIIQPGDIFSYWENINPITPENGYFMGNQIGEDGLPEPVIGGGVCQGSSTLYVAAVRSDLEIVERNNHTVPSAYAIEGEDAMVASWGADLLIRNNTDFPVAIVGHYVDGASIEFAFYGKMLPEGVTIDLEASRIEDVAPDAPIRTPNNKLAPGEEVVKRNPITGSIWTTYKVYFQDGVEFDRVHLNNSYYLAYPAKIEYGPESPTTTTTTTTSQTASEPTTSPTTTTTAPATDPPQESPDKPNESPDNNSGGEDVTNG